jgi:uroporphyrinogen decarboxylase
MTPRERVLAAMRREEVDKVPFKIDFTPPMQQLFQEKTGASDAAEYWNSEIRTVYFQDPRQKAQDENYYTDETLPDGTQLTVWGIAEAPGSMHHFVRMIHPLRNATTVAEIMAYPMPDFRQPECWHHMEDTVTSLHARDLAVMGSLEITIFEIGWYLRGMENLFQDIVLKPEMAEALLERITDLRIFQAQTYARAGVDILALGDDIAMQRGMIMSPRMWQKWFKPRLIRVIDAARAVNPDILVWYHTDGDCRVVIPEIIEAGVNILNPVQPECLDPAEIKSLYGDRLAFSGTIGTQTTMPFGTPKEVKAVIKERIATVGRGGGLLLAPTHVLEPDVPWENVLAFIEAVTSQ